MANGPQRILIVDDDNRILRRLRWFGAICPLQWRDCRGPPRSDTGRPKGRQCLPKGQMPPESSLGLMDVGPAPDTMAAKVVRFLPGGKGPVFQGRRSSCLTGHDNRFRTTIFLGPSKSGRPKRPMWQKPIPPFAVAAGPDQGPQLSPARRAPSERDAGIFSVGPPNQFSRPGSKIADGPANARKVPA